MHSEGTSKLRRRDGDTSLESGVKLLNETNFIVIQSLNDNWKMPS